MTDPYRNDVDAAAGAGLRGKVVYETSRGLFARKRRLTLDFERRRVTLGGVHFSMTNVRCLLVVTIATYSELPCDANDGILVAESIPEQPTLDTRDGPELVRHLALRVADREVLGPGSLLITDRGVLGSTQPNDPFRAVRFDGVGNFIVPITRGSVPGIDLAVRTLAGAIGVDVEHHVLRKAH